MRITNIKPAVKTKGRFNVFIDGAYSFSVDETQLIELKLKVGANIDHAQLEIYQGESEFGKKYVRVLDLILRRPRSQKEITDYARRKGWSEEMTGRVIKKLIARNYINDEAFASFWLRARAVSKPSSKRKLIAELRQKGIASSIIDQVLSGNEAPDELESLRKIVSKKKARYASQEKLMMYLARQGFRYDHIKQVIAEEG